MGGDHTIALPLLRAINYKNKGIDTKNNRKSKLMPYLYLLTCVDNDINVIKS